MQLAIGSAGGHDVAINAQELVTGRTCLIAQSGAGKSWAIAVLCERLCAAGIGFCIVDTEGEYFSLKDRYPIQWVGTDEKCDQNIQKLNLRVAYQQPCASRYSRDKDSLLDEIFDRIGVFRVDRVYDRRHALCCGGPLLSRGDKDQSMKSGKMNLEDARRHVAEALSFICPMCNQTLRRVCEAYDMPRHAVSDLCRMALGDVP